MYVYIVHGIHGSDHCCIQLHDFVGYKQAVVNGLFGRPSHTHESC